MSLYFVFSWIFICPFSVGSFSSVFFSHFIPGPTASPSLRVLFDLYDEVLGFGRLDFVCPVRSRHGSESLSAYW